ncbi:MAG: DUF192 domain-containing protein [Acidobacteria bacterium]|nr:MAG: DUF192 domain-containing protein [Acidobacteriota bacterium]
MQTFLCQAGKPDHIEYAMKKILIASLLFTLCFSIAAKEKTRYGAVILPDKTILTMELATTEEQWIRGLMYRHSLAPGTGMLFIYDHPAPYAFWMKNCFIHLDIIWLSQDKKIVYYVENVPPCDQPDCPSYGSMNMARYVIEVNPGTVKKHKLKLGDEIRIKLFDK